MAPGLEWPRAAHRLVYTSSNRVKKAELLRHQNSPCSCCVPREIACVYKQGSVMVGEPGSAAAAAWSPAAGGRRGRERGRDHMGGGMASGEAPAKMANGFSGMQNEKPSA